MAPQDWSEIARALRVESKELIAQLGTQINSTDLRTAVLVLQALENVAMKMAGGYVYD